MKPSPVSIDGLATATMVTSMLSSSCDEQSTASTTYGRRAGTAGQPSEPQVWASPRTGSRRSDVAAVAPADVEQRLGDLAEAAAAHGVHQDLEQVVAARAPRRAAGRARPVARPAWRAWKSRRRRQLSTASRRRSQRASSSVPGTSPDSGLRNVFTPTMGSEPSCLRVLVEHGLVLDAAPLVAGLHGAEHAAALADPLELGEHRLLDEVGELLDDEVPWSGFSFMARPHSRLMISWMARARRTDFGRRRGDRLVVGVGVQAVAVVVDARRAPAGSCGCR